jgi:excisionase family DNA binding protein
MPEPTPIGKLTTAEVADRLGVTRARVLALIRAGRLPTVRAGPLHLVDPADLERVKVRKPGRPWPPKETPDEARRKTLKKAGVPLPAKRGKRK